jgi:hypothetical protein
MTTTRIRGVRRALSTLVLGAVLGATASVSAQDATEPEEAEEASGPSGSMEADLTFASNYVWRGYVFNDGPVLWPSFTASSEGFAVNAWVNADLGDYGGTLTTPEFSEIDLTLSYDNSIGIVGLGGGAIFYTFPNGGTSTWELYVSAALDLIVSPSLTLYYDLGAVDGLYGLLGVGHSFGFMPDFLSLDIGAGLGFGNQFGVDAETGDSKFELNDVTGSLSLGWSATDYFSVGLGYTLWALIAENAPEGDEVNHSITLSFTYSAE